MGQKKPLFYNILIKKNRIIINILSIILIKTKKLMINLYNLVLYFFLLTFFSYVSIVLFLGRLLKGNLNYLDIIIIVFAFIIELLLVAKIIALRSKWKWLLFYKWTTDFSWKTILSENLYLIFYIIFLNNFLFLINIREIANTHPYLKEQISTLLIVIIFNAIFLFEISFFWVLFNLKGKKKKHSTLTSNLIRMRLANSRKELIIILFLSIYFARVFSKQIDAYFMGLTDIDWGFFIFCFAITSFLFIYFLFSWSALIFKDLKFNYNIEFFENNKSITLFSVFLFFN